jgi:hypothetical protein
MTISSVYIRNCYICLRKRSNESDAMPLLKSVVSHKQQKFFYVICSYQYYYILNLYITITRFEIWHGQKDGKADNFIANFMFGRCLGFMSFLITESGFRLLFRAHMNIRLTLRSITLTTALFNCNYNICSDR